MPLIFGERPGYVPDADKPKQEKAAERPGVRAGKSQQEQFPERPASRSEAEKPKEKKTLGLSQRTIRRLAFLALMGRGFAIGPEAKAQPLNQPTPVEDEYGRAHGTQFPEMPDFFAPTPVRSEKEERAEFFTGIAERAPAFARARLTLSPSLDQFSAVERHIESEIERRAREKGSLDGMTFTVEDPYEYLYESMPPEQQRAEQRYYLFSEQRRTDPLGLLVEIGDLSFEVQDITPESYVEKAVDARKMKMWSELSDSERALRIAKLSEDERRQLLELQLPPDVRYRIFPDSEAREMLLDPKGEQILFDGLWKSDTTLILPSEHDLSSWMKSQDESGFSVKALVDEYVREHGVSAWRDEAILDRGKYPDELMDKIEADDYEEIFALEKLDRWKTMTKKEKRKHIFGMSKEERREFLTLAVPEAERPGLVLSETEADALVESPSLDSVAADFLWDNPADRETLSVAAETAALKWASRRHNETKTRFFYLIDEEQRFLAGRNGYLTQLAIENPASMAVDFVAEVREHVGDDRDRRPISAEDREARDSVRSEIYDEVIEAIKKDPAALERYQKQVQQERDYVRDLNDGIYREFREYATVAAFDAAMADYQAYISLPDGERSEAEPVSPPSVESMTGVQWDLSEEKHDFSLELMLQMRDLPAQVDIRDWLSDLASPYPKSESSYTLSSGEPLSEVEFSRYEELRTAGKLPQGGQEDLKELSKRMVDSATLENRRNYVKHILDQYDRKYLQDIWDFYRETTADPQKFLTDFLTGVRDNISQLDSVSDESAARLGEIEMSHLPVEDAAALYREILSEISPEDLFALQQANYDNIPEEIIQAAFSTSDAKKIVRDDILRRDMVEFMAYGAMRESSRLLESSVRLSLSEDASDEDLAKMAGQTLDIRQAAERDLTLFARLLHAEDIPTAGSLLSASSEELKDIIDDREDILSMFPKGPPPRYSHPKLKDPRTWPLPFVTARPAKKKAGGELIQPGLFALSISSQNINILNTDAVKIEHLQRQIAETREDLEEELSLIYGIYETALDKTAVDLRVAPEE